MRVCGSPNLVGFDYFSGGLRGFPEGYFASLLPVVRNETYKLYVRAGQEEFFDIAKDISETRNLLDGALTREQQMGYDALRRQVTALHASEPTRATP